MEFKKRNMINYLGTAHPILRHGFFNNWTGKYLDRDIFKGLGPFEQTKANTYPVSNADIQTANNIANHFRARNLGELISNFAQSESVNNLLQLRTLTYFAVNAINQDTSINYFEGGYSNPLEDQKDKVVQLVTDEQLKTFYNGVLKALIRQFDFFTAATLLQAPKIVELSNSSDISAVAFDLFEEICKNESPFEEVVYGLFGLFSCSDAHQGLDNTVQFISEEPLTEIAIDALDSVTLKPSSNLEDASIYLMLSYLIERTPDLASSKKFKNKEQHKIFKKIHSLITKPLKLKEVEETSELTKLSRDMVIYINYLGMQNFNIMSDKMMRNKISPSSKRNLLDNLVYLLEREEAILPYLYNDITNAVYKHHPKEKSPSESVCKYLVNAYKGTMSKFNLFFVTKTYGLHQFKEFMTDQRWAHLFNEQQGASMNAQTPVQPNQVNNNMQIAQTENKEVKDLPVANNDTTPVAQSQNVVAPEPVKATQEANQAQSQDINPINTVPGVADVPPLVPIKQEVASTTLKEPVVENKEVIPPSNTQQGFIPPVNTNANQPTAAPQAAKQGQSIGFIQNNATPQGNTSPVCSTTNQAQQVPNASQSIGFVPVSNVPPANVPPMAPTGQQVVHQPTQQVASPQENVSPVAIQPPVSAPQDLSQNTQDNILRNYKQFTVSTGPVSLF